mmetsp:Transcript_57344/g.134446  ORF Transcript_57344/g.134446 Transcript_57344/m.134446 type:complete len:220 (+) Transcript_57344:917-1576(+)
MFTPATPRYTMKPGSSAVHSLGGFDEKSVCSCNSSRMGSSSPILMDMSLLRNVRSKRSMSDFPSCSEPVAGVPALSSPPVTVASAMALTPLLLFGLPWAAGQSQSASLPFLSSVHCSVAVQVASVSPCCALLSICCSRNADNFPEAHLDKSCSTSASDTTGSSFKLSNASTKHTGICSHLPAASSVTSMKCRRLRRAKSKVCQTNCWNFSFSNENVKKL